MYQNNLASAKNKWVEAMKLDGTAKEAGERGKEGRKVGTQEGA